MDPDPDAPPWVQETQIGLGAALEKPRLITDRLKRPPFRFLFDIVTALFEIYGRDLAFFDDLLPSGEMPSSKQDKMDWIGRWASIIGEQLGEAPIEISPLKVVCGQEPERTNLLLQKTWALVCQRSSVAAGAVANTTNGQGTPQTGQNGHKNSSGAVPGEEQSGAPLANEPESLLQSRRRSSEGARQRTEAFQKALAEMTSYKAEWLHSEEYKTAAHLEVPISLDEDSGSEVEDVTGEQECEESAGSPLSPLHAKAAPTTEDRKQKAKEELLQEERFKQVEDIMAAMDAEFDDSAARGPPGVGPGGGLPVGGPGPMIMGSYDERPVSRGKASSSSTGVRPPRSIGGPGGGMGGGPMLGGGGYDDLRPSSRHAAQRPAQAKVRAASGSPLRAMLGYEEDSPEGSPGGEDSFIKDDDGDGLSGRTRKKYRMPSLDQDGAEDHSYGGELYPRARNAPAARLVAESARGRNEFDDYDDDLLPEGVNRSEVVEEVPLYPKARSASDAPRLIASDKPTIISGVDEEEPDLPPDFFVIAGEDGAQEQGATTPGRAQEQLQHPGRAQTTSNGAAPAEEDLLHEDDVETADPSAETTVDVAGGEDSVPTVASAEQTSPVDDGPVLSVETEKALVMLRKTLQNWLPFVANSLASSLAKKFASEAVAVALFQRILVALGRHTQAVEELGLSLDAAGLLEDLAAKFPHDWLFHLCTEPAADLIERWGFEEVVEALQAVLQTSNAADVYEIFPPIEEQPEPDEAEDEERKAAAAHTAQEERYMPTLGANRVHAQYILRS